MTVADAAACVARRQVRWGSFLLVLLVAPAGASFGGVRIVRDNYGVPHVYAGDLEGLFHGFGYAVAEDRLFQLEMMRRSVWGAVAEVLGSDFLDFEYKPMNFYSADVMRAAESVQELADH